MARPASVLSLDIAPIVGWAHGRRGSLPTHGIWPLPAKDPIDLLGARVVSLENTLHDFIAEYSPGLVVIAERFVPRGAKAALLLLALDGAVRGECWRAKVPMKWQPESQVRKEMLGRGQGPTAEMKALSVKWCTDHGLDPDDDNSADAIVLWCWTQGELARRAPVTA